MNITQRIKDLDLTEEQKMLIKYGVENKDGSIGSAGRDLLVEILYKQNRDEIVKQVKRLEESGAEAHDPLTCNCC